MESFISHYLLAWQPLGYLLAFLGMILEGEVLLILAGFLTSQGYFNFFYMFAALLLGALFGDFFWYRFGHYLFNTSGLKFPEWLHRLSHPLDIHLRDRPRKTIFISKFVYGANRATLMRAGASGVSLKDFFESNVYANIVWIIVIGGLGYLFGASLALLKKYIRLAELVILISVIIFLFASHFLVLRYKDKHEEDELENG